MTPSTLSRIIQRLEAEHNRAFFVRDNRSVALTEAGIRFAQFSRTVLEEWRQLKFEFDSTTQELTGELTVYCTVTAAHLYLPRILEQFRQRFPKVEIDLKTGDVAAAYKQVNEGTADFAFAVAPDSLPKKFVFQHLEHIPFKLIAPKQSTPFSHLLKPGRINWQKLPFVMPESGPAQQRIQQWLKRMNIKPEVRAQVSGNEAIVSLTALGIGVSAVPAPVLELSPAKHKIQILSAQKVPDPFDLGIVCLKRRLSEPVMNSFWQLVME